MVFFHFGKYPPFSIIFPITTYIILFQHSTFPELTSPKCCDFSSALTHLCTWSSWQRGEALKRWTLIVYNLKFQMWREMFCLISEKHINLLDPGGENTGSLCGQCVGTEGKQWLRNQSLQMFTKQCFQNISFLGGYIKSKSGQRWSSQGQAVGGGWRLFLIYISGFLCFID